MSAPTLKEHLRKEIADNTKLFIDDLEAMPEEMLATKPGGVARCPYDFTYEVSYVNNRIVKRLRGEDPGPWNPMPWTTAPEEFCNKEKAISTLRESMDALLSEWDRLPESDLTKEITTPTGTTTPLQMANLAGVHVMYHDAQLNYIQTLSGDGEMHWKF